MDSPLHASELQHPRRAALPRRADLALARPPLRDPRLAHHLLQRLDQRHDTPRATRLAALLVGRQLDRAELQVDVAPVQHANLLLARRRRSRPAPTASASSSFSAASSCANSDGVATRSRGFASIAGKRTLAAGSCPTRSRSCAHRYSERSAFTTLRTREPDAPARVISSMTPCTSPRVMSPSRRRASESGNAPQRRLQVLPRPPPVAPSPLVQRHAVTSSGDEVLARGLEPRPGHRQRGSLGQRVDEVLARVPRLHHAPEPTRLDVLARRPIPHDAVVARRAVARPRLGAGRHLTRLPVARVDALEPRLRVRARARRTLLRRSPRVGLVLGPALQVTRPVEPQLPGVDARHERLHVALEVPQAHPQAPRPPPCASAACAAPRACRP